MIVVSTMTCYRLLHRRSMLKLVAGVGLAGYSRLNPKQNIGSATSTSEAAPRQQVGHQAPPNSGPGGGGPESTQTSDTASGELPRGDWRTISRRWFEWARTCGTRAGSYAATSPRASDPVPGGRRRAAQHHHDHQRLRQRQIPSGWRRRLPYGTATEGRYSSTPEGVTGENTCVASRRPMIAAR